MKLSLLFMMIASTPFKSIDLALASGESEAVEFVSVLRYLKANSTIEQEDEERMRPPTKLTNDQVLARLENLFPELTAKIIKNAAKKHVGNIKSATIKGEKDVETKKRIFYSLLAPTFLQELRSRTSFFHEKFVDLALYLALVESVDGSLQKAAKQISDAIEQVEKNQEIQRAMEAAGKPDYLMVLKENGVVGKKVDDILYEEDAVAILHRMETGQFLLWNKEVGDPSRVKSSILGVTHSNIWKNKVEERYKSFRADVKKRQIPQI